MTVILFIILLVYVYSVSRRVKNIEIELNASRAPGKLSPEAERNLAALNIAIPHATSAEAVTTSSLTPIPVPQAAAPDGALPAIPPVSTAVPPSLETGFDLIAWIKEDFFVKLGALLLLIAGGWFVSYAFANNWIGPWGRIALGMLAGALVYGVGVYRVKMHSQQGSIFMVLGSAFVIMSVWAARDIYDFFTPTTALLIMVIPIVLTAYQSVRHHLPGLAVASVLLGAAAPLFTAAAEPNLFTLSIYLLVLVVGTLWVALLIDSTALTPVAIGIVALWNIPYLTSASSVELQQGLVFALAFTTCFFVSNVANLLMHHANRITLSHILSGLGTGLYLYVWIATATSGVLESLLYVLGLIGFALAGWIVYVHTKNRDPLSLYGAVAVAYLVPLTASLFSGAVLTMVFASELALLFVVLTLASVERRTLSLLAWTYVPLGLLSLQHITAQTWTNEFLHRDFFALLLVGLSLITAGGCLTCYNSKTPEKLGSATLFVAGGVYLFTVLGLSLHAKLDSQFADTLLFLVAATVSTVLYTSAVRLQFATVKKAAKILAASHVLAVPLALNYAYTPAWATGIFHGDAATFLGSIIIYGLLTCLAAQKEVRAVSTQALKILSSITLGFCIVAVWVVLHALVVSGVATTVSLIMYTLIGIGLFVQGRQSNHAFIRRWGAVLLCGVVLRLLTVEIWTLSLTARIIVFFVVGLLLISTAFIGRRKAD